MVNYKTAWIVGKGVSGAAAFDALCKSGCECVMTEGLEIPSGVFDVIVVSPGVKPSHPAFSYASKNGVKLIGELELGFLLCGDVRIAAVTGTNGKTTCVSMIADMLCCSACGNIGKPLCDFAGTHEKMLAVEASSFQLMSIDTFRPAVAAITNLAPDHLNYHKDLDEYINAKLNIAKNMKREDILILPCNLNVSYLKNFFPACTIYYTSKDSTVMGAYINNGDFYWLGQRVCSTEVLGLKGAHNLENALTSMAVSFCMGANADAVIKSFKNAAAPNHRIKAVMTKNGRTYYDDSKATNVAAALAGARTMLDETCIILGGSDKGEDFTQLFKDMPPAIACAVVTGATAAAILKSAQEAGFNNIVYAQSLAEAVRIASKKNVKNVLLSPACASFDCYGSYAERGEDFIKIVSELEENGG